MHNGTGERAYSVTLRAVTTTAIVGWTTVWLGVLLSGAPVAMAEHEADHRFTVEGSVCGTDGQPLAGVEVVAKDARTSLVRTTQTDDRGQYRVTLHLHNDNRGDPIVVYVKDKDGTVQQERRVAAEFDPKDVHTERKTAVHFGSGCEALSDEPPLWVYQGAGAAVLAVGVWAGARLLRSRRHPAKGHKGAKR